MTVNYTLEDEKVKETITVPSREEIKDLGEKSAVIAALEAKKAAHQVTIDAITSQIAEIQTKLDAITVL